MLHFVRESMKVPKYSNKKAFCLGSGFLYDDCTMSLPWSWGRAVVASLTADEDSNFICEKFCKIKLTSSKVLWRFQESASATKEGS